MSSVVKYVAELDHVREVSLLGSADLAFWKERLAQESLTAAEEGGKARILVIAADGKFMGVRFREASFSVLVKPPDGYGRRDAAFLDRAFNSNRLFAFCERFFFSTPYYHAGVRVSASLPASVEVARRGEVVFRAEMRTEREPSRCGEDGWEGPVFLPGPRPGKGGSGRLFFAKLRGHTRTYPFLSSVDSLSIRPSQDGVALQALVDSRFACDAWVVRADAAHCKSKTYKRSDVFAGLPALVGHPG